MISTKFPEALKFNHFIFETAKWEEKYDFCDYEMASCCSFKAERIVYLLKFIKYGKMEWDVVMTKCLIYLSALT